MTLSSERSSQDLSREADESRAQLSSTLDTLKERLTPGQIFDEIFEGSGENANRMLRNLGAALRDNPVPAVLVGAGIAMWATGTSPGLGGFGRKSYGRNGAGVRGSSSYRGYGGSEHDSGRYRDRSGQQDDSMMSGLADKARKAASSVGDALSGAAESASQMAGDARDGMSSAMDRMSDTGSAMSRQASGIANLVTDQPLLAAAIGIAAGAVLGAALPATRLENEWMGETGEAVRDRAGSFASEQFEAVTEAARATARDVTKEAKAQGLTPEEAMEATGSIGDKLAAVGDKAADSLKRETRDMLGVTGQSGQGSTGGQSSAGQSSAGQSSTGQASTGQAGTSQAGTSQAGRR
jgi:ElaB/YqjD/DUF883 family membrane-anchored ribosome-binding protein